MARYAVLCAVSFPHLQEVVHYVLSLNTVSDTKASACADNNWYYYV